MARYMRPHGRFAHCIFTLAVRQPPVLASCIEIYYFHIVPPVRKIKKKKICCEGYSKACSRKIWLWSLSNITSKKKFQKIQKFFLATIFLKLLFFVEVLLVSITYTCIFFIKIGEAVFKKNHFLNFSKKMNF